MSKKRTRLVATFAVFQGNASSSTSKPVQLPFTRPLSLDETKLLWDVERALNSLPLEGGSTVRIDVVPVTR